jgi:hypothetical protein
VQSEIDLNVASAAAKVKEALDDVDHGIIALGSLFGVKTDRRQTSPGNSFTYARADAESAR